MTALSAAATAALSYAKHGWPVFPMSARKVPLTQHGVLDATVDEAIIGAWWERYPNASPAIATGKASGIVALDVDIRPGVHGPDSLQALGVASHPTTPTAHSPSGGYHILFRWPGYDVRSSTSTLGPGLDVRGDGGSLILPPGPRRRWDPHLAYDETPLADMPEWMRNSEREQPPHVDRLPPRGRDYSRYGEGALNRIVAAILGAPLGRQEVSINAGVFSIGQLVAGGEIGPDFAMQTLVWLSTAIPSLDMHRPWRPVDLLKKMRSALADGMQYPRSRPDGR